MKELIEQQFQGMLKGAYGHKMITKEQQTDMKLSFVSGMMIALKLSINEVKSLSDLAKLDDAVTEIFHETNNNR